MELPQRLRSEVEFILEGISTRDLELATNQLSERYRSEKRDGRLHLHETIYAQAYLATRLPATFAATRASFEKVADLLPDFAPKTLLDAGSGPGTAFFAAEDCWPTLKNATLIEASAPIRALGERLAAQASDIAPRWEQADLGRTFPDTEKADLVTLCYVLNELSPDQGTKLVDALWTHCTNVLILVEPGTPEGWKRLMRHRDQLLENGGKVIAPCPHEKPCALIGTDWCHFSQRVARSRVHRTAKAASVPYEDEKYAFLAVSRQQTTAPYSRVLARAQHGSGKTTLKLCKPDGLVSDTMYTKRDGQSYKQARKLEWGDILEDQETEAATND